MTSMYFLQMSMLNIDGEFPLTETQNLPIERQPEPVLKWSRRSGVHTKTEVRLTRHCHSLTTTLRNIMLLQFLFQVVEFYVTLQTVSFPS